MAEMHFGFYPYALDYSVGCIQIRTLDDFPTVVEATLSNPFIEGDWFYSPPRRTHLFGTDTIAVSPYPARIFDLPHTHALTRTAVSDPNRLRFLVWCFGFFVGMRMTDKPRGFLDATPIREGICNDIVWLGNGHVNALEIADTFFGKHLANPRVEVIARAAIHSYLSSHTPTLLDFERFIHLYTAMEACFAIQQLVYARPKQTPSHAERIAYLCEQLGIPVPGWASRSSGYIAKQRNFTLHEGLFFEAPWGFSIFGGNENRDPQNQSLLLEMTKLVCRILLAQLGIDHPEYLTSSIADRQRHGIRI